MNGHLSLVLGSVFSITNALIPNEERYTKNFGKLITDKKMDSELEVLEVLDTLGELIAQRAQTHYSPDTIQ